MSGWDISTSGVQFVTSLVEDAMDDVAKDVKAYASDVESAAASAGTISGPYCGAAPTGAIGAALALFVEGTAEEVLFLGARAAKSVNGAREATACYALADLDMAAEAQRRALAAPKVDPPGGDQGGGGREGRQK
ncbi:DUF6507 family protein [Streptomyces xinghaiensis]|uniref:DUF6507 family protein n=1 Tax=Streptomyces xinghaiensis TaxID=1038928 RepID=UPI000584775C|nr:DUF6507 family protein [Streptomyces xinghaiensis]MZE79365.1 hypothetical protein [Streptomyces sp. SID5475]